MADDFSAFPVGNRVPKKVADLARGRGKKIITLKFAEVHAGGEPGRQQLETFVKKHGLDVRFDPFKDEWRVWRPTTGDIFEGSAAHG